MQTITLKVDDKEAESLRLLSSIQKGLDDVKAHNIQPIDKLWEQLDA